MSWVRLTAVTCSVAALLACRYAAAAEGGTPSADEPSIEEMFAEIEASKNAAATPVATPGKTTDAASRAAEPGPPAPRPPVPKISSKPRKPPADVEKEIKKIQKRAQECYAVLRMRKHNWEIVQLYIRLERYKKAAETLYPLLRARPAGDYSAQRSWGWGGYDLEYAFIMKHLDQEKITNAMLGEHSKKLAKARAGPYDRSPRSYDLTRINKRLTFFDNYPEARRRVEELEAALAKGREMAAGGAPPAGTGNAEKLWELVNLCRPGSYKAELPLKWFAALYELVTKYPDHALLRSGKVQWEYHRACRLHRLHEDCIKILTPMLERFPELYDIKTGNGLWELAESYENLGRHIESLRDRRERARAVLAYREAVKRYKEFKKVFPKNKRSLSHTSEGGHVTPARVNVALDRIETSIRRLSR